MKNNFFAGFACFFLLSLIAPSSLASQNIEVTNSVWKALRSSLLPPVGWNQLAFDDSSWGASVEVSQATCLDPYGQRPASGFCGTSRPIWADRDGYSCSIPGDLVYFRKTFKIPKPQEGCDGYILYVRADNNSEIYVNGNFIGSTTNNWLTGDVFGIPNAYLNIGINKNVIAVKASDDGVTGWFSAILCRPCL